MDKAIAEEIESKHAALHALIDEEEHRAHPDEDLLHRLKKEKLRLKDELAGHLTHCGGLFCGRRSRTAAPGAGQTWRDTLTQPAETSKGTRHAE